MKCIAFFAPGGFHEEKTCWALLYVNIQSAVDEKTHFWQFENVSCPLVTVFIKLGMCLVALADWQLTQQEWAGTGQTVSREWVRLGSTSKSGWHLSRCTSGFRSEDPPPPPCHMCYSLGLHAAGLTLPCKKNSHHPIFASGIQLNTSPAGLTWPTYSSYSCTLPPPFLFGSLADSACFRLLRCQAQANML